jgi:hypothetical protein
MTPAEYKKQYKALKVDFIATDTTTVTVSLDKYLISRPDLPREGASLIEKAKDYLTRQKSVDPSFTLALIVDGRVATFGTWDQLKPYLAPPFYGKGSPEEYQIVAQIAVLTNRSTAANLQKYFDDHLGIDCNGFVGNFLWHRNADWQEPAAADRSRSITEFINSKDGRAIGDIDDIQPGELNVFGLVRETTLEIIPSAVWTAEGLGESGHVFISEPGRFHRIPRFPPLLTPVFQLWAVESTGGKGLAEDWCTITEFADAKGKPRSPHGFPHHRIFNVHRNSKDMDNLFAITAYSL